MKLLVKIYNKVRFEYRKPYEQFIVRLHKKIFGTGEIIKKIFNNNMVLDLEDEGISRRLFFKGVHEKLSTQQYIRNIKEGMHVLEIGANIGYYALIAANLLGKSGKVYAFEPNPKSLKLLNMNIYLNGYKDMFEVYPYGVGSENEVCEFYVMNKNNTSGFTKKKGSDLIEKEKLNLKVVCLDDFFAKGVKIDYFRMDVEGYEYNIINGMKNILSSKNKPKGCFIEIHPNILRDTYDLTARDFVLLLKSYGYIIELSMYRGLKSQMVHNNDEYFNHMFAEKDYWETFFVNEVI